MLKLMRDSFQQLKWILVAIVAIFILFIFVDWGAGGAGGRAAERGFAARVNGETISYRDFNRAMYFAEENYKQMYGNQFTPDMAAAMGLNRQVLDSLVDQRLILQEARRLHLQATPEEVRRRILEIPVLNPDGHFIGAELYTRYINEMGYSNPAEFEDDLSRQITIDKMESALVSSMVVSPKSAEDEMRRNSENAKIRYVLQSADRELAIVNVSPADVDAYYKANQTNYAHGEQRDLKYLLADLTRLRSQVVPTEPQLRDRYNKTRETDFKRPESAHIFHILIKVDPNATPAADAAARAKAEGLVRQLRAGGDFAALARANSQDPSSSANGGDMGYIDRGATVEPFDQAAFTIPLNTISDPIRSKEFGYHIIKVVDRKPAGYRTFEEVRGQLAAQLTDQLVKDQAREEISRIAARLKEKKPASPAEFSANANDRVSSNDTQWFQKGDQIQGLGSNPQLASWAFAAKPGDVSEVFGTSRGPIVAYVSGVRPAGVTPLSDIRAKVEHEAKLAKARQAAAQKLAAAMAGATTVDQVATKTSITPLEVTVSHQGIVAGIPGNTAALVKQALSAKVGELKGPVLAGDGAVVFQVLDQRKMTPAEVASGRQSFVDQLRVRQARALRASLLQRLRKASKIDINEQVLEQKGSQNPTA